MTPVTAATPALAITLAPTAAESAGRRSKAVKTVRLVTDCKYITELYIQYDP
jgi:hypothetical protein